MAHAEFRWWSGVSQHAPDSNDVGVMSTSEGIEVPGAATVRLVPGGDHVMLEGVGANLLPDDRFALRLEFERAGLVEVEVEVVPLESLVEGEGP
ncbi:MAG: copper chaperone PCu(A)C [Actinomycetota bacterium]